MRARASITSLGLWILVFGCSGESGLTPGEDPALGPPDYTELACPEDPDCFTGGTCGMGCPDYWVCTDGVGPGGKRCWNPESFPDEGSWTCEDTGGSTVCRGDHMPDDGASRGWSCEEQGEFVECSRDATYPDDGATNGWDCYVAGEFRVCDASDGGLPDDGNGGPYDCWLTGDDLVECEGGEGAPDGGDDLCWVVDPGAVGERIPGDLGTVIYGNYAFGQLDGVDSVYVSFAFTEAFVDNTYGVNASQGWNRHTFRDLVGSDKATVRMTDGNGDVALEFILDYISEADEAPSGYRALGVTGGEGRMVVGDESAILHAVTSLDRNLNQRGCVFTTDSPGPGECPEWDPQVVYEMFVRVDAFGAAGVGGPAIGEVHASPSKLGENTVPVTPEECPAP